METPTQTSSSMRLTEAVVLTLPHTQVALKDGALHCQPEGFHWYLHLHEGGRNLVFTDGQSYDAAAVAGLHFSPNGHRYAFCLKQPDGREQLVLNGQPSESFDSVSAMTFSRDGQAFACLGARSRAIYLLLQMRADAAAIVEGPKASPRELTFNPATNELAYFLYEGGRWRLVYGLAPHPAFAASGELQFSPDGRSHVYWAKNGMKTFAVLDGIPGDPCEGVGEFVFGPTAGQLAYLVNRQGNLSVWHNGALGPAYVKIRRLLFNAGGNTLAYVAGDGNQEIPVVAHARQPAFDRVYSLVLGSKTGTYACIGGRTGEKYVVHNGQQSSAYEELGQLCISASRDSVAYAAYRDKQWFVIHNGEASDTYAGVDDLAFSPDGSRLAYLARIRGQGTALVVDGRVDKPYLHAKNLVFSDDGKHTAYLAKQGDGWYLLVDGFAVNSRAYNEVLTPVRYHGAHGFHVLVRQGTDVLRVTCG